MGFIYKYFLSRFTNPDQTMIHWEQAIQDKPACLIVISFQQKDIVMQGNTEFITT